MRLRLRGPSGASPVSLGSSATVQDLLTVIEEKTGLSYFDIRVGYPPQLLALSRDEVSKPLSDLDIHLDGEQLIVSAAAPPEDIFPSATDATASLPTGKQPQASQPSSSGENTTSPLALTRKSNREVENEPPEIPSPAHGATLILRIMPDDNSCMFRAFGSAVMGSVDSMTELRSLIAQTIQSQPDDYSAAVLDQKPDEYCKWIQTEYSWGGGIELSILSKHFDIEICSIDVQSLRVDRFNEGRPMRCILVYSGIHYDLIALSPSEPPYSRATASPEFDTKVFDTSDEVLLQGAVKLCKVLQGKHYFTDTAGFAIGCNVCGAQVIGEKGATQHAKDTGHMDFGEAG
ncbi:MAG: ubiquitin-specific protease otu1 [Caeruleum heppii]|nr:MAG: ubiquitin-specific protease otu1 [Caeruleum heppii]